MYARKLPALVGSILLSYSSAGILCDPIWCFIPDSCIPRKLCSQLRREFSDTVLAGQLSTVFRAGQLFSRRPRFLRGFVWVLQPDCLQSRNLSAVQWLHQLHRYFSWLFYDIFQLNFSDRLLSRNLSAIASQSSCMSASPATLYPGLLVSLRLVVIQVYQPLSNQTFCLQATPGHYVPTGSSANQTPCDAGSYQPSYGSTECINSSGGHYVDSPGSTSETPCPAGTYNPFESANSSTFCIDCRSGTLCPYKRVIRPDTVSEGNYQPSSGQFHASQLLLGTLLVHQGPVQKLHVLPDSGGTKQDFQNA